MSLFGTLYNTDLPPRAKCVYMYLCDRANHQGTCFPGIKTIARDTSLSVSTVKRAVADLVRHGLVGKKARFRENGGRSSNLYSLTDKE